MKNYDGWTMKMFLGDKQYLIAGYFHETRSGVVDDFEKTTKEDWRKYRRTGIYKIVKVKLVEAWEKP